MSEYTSEEFEAIQRVVDRVAAYQDGAVEGTVEQELRKGCDEAGLDLPVEHIETLATAINETDGNVDSAALLA
ncbi:hypothetical protein [Aeromicrobium sp. P5_D10]